jgi:hypothetical protein
MPILHPFRYRQVIIFRRRAGADTGPKTVLRDLLTRISFGYLYGGLARIDVCSLLDKRVARYRDQFYEDTIPLDELEMEIF